jgi:hypothetical protein
MNDPRTVFDVHVKATVVVVVVSCHDSVEVDTTGEGSAQTDPERDDWRIFGAPFPVPLRS